MRLKNIYNTILSFLFTKRCRYCNNVCDIRDEICPECADSIYTIDGEICYNCGCSKLVCNKKERKHFYKSICAPFYYDGAPKKAIIHNKYKSIPSVIQGLSEDMLSSFKKHYSHLNFDCCTYVPMHPEDEKNRGFNQSQLLAEHIAKQLNIPCYRLLKKDFRTKSQHKLPMMLRSGNVLGTMSFNKDCNVSISDMRILLVDDIKTTGATLDECTKVLLFENCAEVRCITACVRKTQEKEKTESK